VEEPVNSPDGTELLIPLPDASTVPPDSDDSAGALARWQQEQQALALMHYPGRLADHDQVFARSSDVANPMD
jgi:hypothetical protein